MRVLWTWAGVAALALGVIVWGLIFWCCIRYRKQRRPTLPAPDQVQPADRDRSASIVPVHHHRRAVLPHGRRRGLRQQASARTRTSVVQVDAFKWNWQFEYHTYRGPSGSRPRSRGRCLLRPGQPGKQLDRPRRPEPPLYLSTVGSQNEIPVLVMPGRPDGADRRALRGRHPLVLGAGVPVQARRDPVRHAERHATTTSSSSPPTSTGSYVGRCAELCGTYHSQMNFEVRVVSQQTFVELPRRAEADRPRRPGPAGARRCVACRA